MKNIILFLCLLSSMLLFSQAYIGKGDSKFQIGANIQADGTGLVASFDRGVGENISLGLQSIYLLGVTEFSNNTFDTIEDAKLLDRLDIRARFNAHLGNVININENFDLYPGLNVGIKNLGTHLGARYFFSSGLGTFLEFNLPIAKFQDEDSVELKDKPRFDLNNQLTISLGASFNL